MKIMLMLLLAAIFCSCNERTSETPKIQKVEKVSFSINDSLIDTRNSFKIGFYSSNDSVILNAKNDSIQYEMFNNESLNVGIEFLFNDYHLRFDSIPTNLLNQQQHIDFEFGIRDSSVFKHNFNSAPKYAYAKIPGIHYQFFSINPSDSGIQRYFEKPYLKSK